MLQKNMIIDSCQTSKKDSLYFRIRREEIIDILKKIFASKNGINLPIYGVDKNNLIHFTTTQKDVKRGLYRFPPNQFRLKDEDLLEERET